MDLAALYASTRTRISELVAGLPPERLGAPVPATPAWTVRDLVAHLAGAASDVVAGRLEGAPGDEWTARQVQERAGRPVDELIAEWAEAAVGLEALIPNLPGSLGNVLLADVTTHEHDLRGALGEPGARDSDAVDVMVQWLVASLGRKLSKKGAPALRIRAGSDEWIIGDGEPAATVTVDPFDLYRALMGRRSVAQMRAFAWEGDPARYLEVFPAFPPPASDLVE